MTNEFFQKNVWQIIDGQWLAADHDQRFAIVDRTAIFNGSRWYNFQKWIGML
jgi:hypothetical protein